MWYNSFLYAVYIDVITTSDRTRRTLQALYTTRWVMCCKYKTRSRTLHRTFNTKILYILFTAIFFICKRDFEHSNVTSTILEIFIPKEEVFLDIFQGGILFVVHCKIISELVYCNALSALNKKSWTVYQLFIEKYWVVSLPLNCWAILPALQGNWGPVGFYKEHIAQPLLFVLMCLKMLLFMNSNLISIGKEAAFKQSWTLKTAITYMEDENTIFHCTQLVVSKICLCVFQILVSSNSYLNIQVSWPF